MARIPEEEIERLKRPDLARATGVGEGGEAEEAR